MQAGGAALVAAAVSLVMASGFAALTAWAGPLDSPRARGLHSHPTVTSGGLAVVAATSAGLAAFAALSEAPTPHLSAAALALGLAGALGLLGALDDLIDLGAKAKLLAQGLFGLMFALMVGRIEGLPISGELILPLGVAVGAVGTALWLVVVTNAVNFVDGVDGLAAGSVAIVLAALSLAGFAQGEPAVGGAALSAALALAGFLPWNLPARRLFQGDAGALFSGFLLAGLAVVAAERVSLYLVPFALTPILADVLLTLAWRARRGERLFDAHRDHLYQLWLRKTGRPHGAVTVRVWALTALYAGAGLASLAAPMAAQPLLLALGVAIAAVGWRLIRGRLEAVAAAS